MSGSDGVDGVSTGGHQNETSAVPTPSAAEGEPPPAVTEQAAVSAETSTQADPVDLEDPAVVLTGKVSPESTVTGKLPEPDPGYIERIRALRDKTLSPEEPAPAPDPEEEEGSS